jgi:hypothetical protein
VIAAEKKKSNPEIWNTASMVNIQFSQPSERKDAPQGGPIDSIEKKTTYSLR